VQPAIAAPEASPWLLRQVAEKESATATVAWLRRHLGGDKAVSQRDSDITPEIAGSGAKLVPSSALSEMPAAAIGRLFMTRGNQERSSCTAFKVSPDTVMTAAHCVMTRDGHWQRDLVFVTGLGTEALSARGVQCVVVDRNWGAIGSELAPGIDYAVMSIDAGTTPSYLALDIDGTAEAVSILGYRSDCCGNRLLEVSKRKSEISRNQNHFVSSNNLLVMGSSGSPWISQSTGKVISLNAQYPSLGSARLNGPRFDQRTRAMLQTIQASCQ